MRTRLAQIARLNRAYGGKFTRRTAVLIIVIGVAIGLLEAMVLRAITDLAGLITDTGERRLQFPIIGELGGAGTVALSVGATLIVILLRWIDAQAATRFSLQPMERVRSELSAAFLRANHLQQQSHREGEIQEILSTHAPAVGLTFLGIASGLSALVIVLVLSLVAVVREPLAFIALALALVVVAALIAPLQRQIAKRSEALGATQIRYGEHTSGTVQLSQEFKLFAGASDAALERLDGVSGSVTGAATRLMALTRFASNLYRSLVLLLLVGGLGIMVVADVGSVTTTGAVLLLLIRALMESQLVYANIALVTEKLPYAMSIDSLVVELDAGADSTGNDQLSAVHTVELTGAQFDYSAAMAEDSQVRGLPSMGQVTMKIGLGEKLGVVGASGQGKSTMLAMVAGLIEPTAGSVAINGGSPSAFGRASFSREVAVVPQTARLITLSVRDNVRFFRDWIDDDAIEWAMRSVGLHDEVVSWPDGYDTVIGHRGARGLSGGQAQRVCVARALAGRPSLLLMDEPTSALDDISEALFTDALNALGDQCTAIVVSHRRSALTACSRIVELTAEGLREEIADGPG